MKSRFFAYFISFAFASILALPLYADPIAGYDQTSPAYGQSPRSGTASPRSTAPAPNKAGAVATSSRGVSAPSRSVANRGTSARSTTSAEQSRSVVARTATPAAAQSNRTLRARSATAATDARASLSGTPIRPTSSTTTTNTYLASRLYTGTYSNIIDPTTGLISADAYSNCVSSYYTCMDEICTARNQAQRRCACAGRVKNFTTIEQQLQTAKEELLRVSGDLQLIMTAKGEDITSAFTLTDAEKGLNCVSWRNAYQGSAQDKIDWCKQNPLLSNKTSDQCDAGYTETPAFVSNYCTSNTFGWGTDWNSVVSSLNGADTSILSGLQNVANQISSLDFVTQNNNNGLFDAFTQMSNIAAQLGGTSVSNLTVTTDSLAETWGYDLFAFAHNNVCNRVLDSCFNGIFESCGSPPSGTRCPTGQSICPFNYNTTITINNTGDSVPQFVKPGSTYAVNTTATCYGYNTTSGDPYSTLRGPVADARRSILNKYVLDANADCDAYGETLKTQVQNVGLQKVMVQQLLQQQRQQFALDKQAVTLADATTAGTNFNSCIGQIYECYNQQVTSNPSWTTSRIKTFCAQISSVPSCYETMICNPSASQFKAVIDTIDGSCVWSQDYTKNTCRNIVTLNEILTKAATNAAASLPAEGATAPDSAAIREMCLQAALGDLTGPGSGNIRGWERPCPSGTSEMGQGLSVDGMAQCKCQVAGTRWDGQNCQSCYTPGAATYQLHSCLPASCNATAGYSLQGQDDSAMCVLQ